MKTILIATDFSPASRNASMFGIQLAKAFKANIILFNAFRANASPLELKPGKLSMMRCCNRINGCWKKQIFSILNTS